MPKSEKKTEILKLRVTEQEYESIKAQAQKNHTTTSDVIRTALFTDNNDMSTAIHAEIHRQKIYNLLQHTKMPTESRKLLIKELNTHE